ncbi:MAG TPA: hypothetical protein DCQ36_14090 [Actinobacteria bacterium]|nr:hypothetical protein [Actinomycetota bacterium]
MDEEISIPVPLPCDSDGFLRRECPSCEGQFKWLITDDDSSAIPPDQYFCPLCGVAADTNSWFTREQLEFMQSYAAPQIERMIQEAVGDAFGRIDAIEFKTARSLEIDSDTVDALVEPDDMLIAEPPCHPSEPVKVPEERMGVLFCLLCGGLYEV